MTRVSTAEARVLTSGAFFTPIRITRMAILIALSAVGAFVKIPTPTGDMGLDSAPGYFAGMVKRWDWREAQTIGIFARLLAAWVVGFPLGLPIQILLGILLGGMMGVVVRVPRLKWGMVPGWIAGTFYNGVLVPLAILPSAIFIIGGGKDLSSAIGVGVASFPGLIVASGLAIAIGMAAHEAFIRTGVVRA